MNALILSMAFLTGGAPAPPVRDMQPLPKTYVMTWGTEKFELELREKTYVYKRISVVGANLAFSPVGGEWTWNNNTRVFSMTELDSSSRMTQWNIFLDGRLNGKLLSIIDHSGVDNVQKYIGVTLKEVKR